MRFTNPIHQAIYEKVVTPALQQRAQDVEGHVVGIDYEKQTVDIYWKDATSGMYYTSQNVPLPKEENGVFKQFVEVGDRVSLSFRYGDKDHPYINAIYKQGMDGSQYKASYGSRIPKQIPYL